MPILFADFETYWDAEYTLRKMTPLEYVLDPRFEALGCAFCWDNDPEFWIDGPDLPEFFSTVDWKNVLFVTHNSLFDCSVMRFNYNILPGVVACSMSMARAHLGGKVSGVSLDKVSEYYGLPSKWKTVEKFKGVCYSMLRLDQALYDETVAYAKDDVGKCRFIFNKILSEGFPASQIELHDMVLRMTIDPAFVLDTVLLHEYAGEIKAEKEQLLASAGLADRTAIMSDVLLADMLRSQGVEPPTKVSKTTGEQVYAFAKTDKDFTDLQEDPNPMVQAIVAARLGHKTTIEETRCGRLIALSNVDWKTPEWQHTIPVPLKISGAHTHRLSGDWKLNLQNLLRNTPKKKSKLRASIKAPRGKVIASCDASQIEARLIATLAGQDDLVESFYHKRDVYAEFASSVYGFPVNKNTHKVERQLGKVGILSLGYGAWWPTFQAMVRAQSGGEMAVSDSEAAKVVSIYRNKYTRIVQYWKSWDNLIPQIANGSAAGLPVGPIIVGNQCLHLPNGTVIHYHNLRQELFDGKLKWCYNSGNRIKSLYGAKIAENVTQALAFIHIIESARTIKKLSQGLLMPKHQIHDELLYVVDEKLGEQVGKLCANVFSQPPAWLPNAPLAAEWGVGPSYGEIDK